jgi:lipopolysaccharide biosynthesis regulator YciM
MGPDLGVTDHQEPYRHSAPQNYDVHLHLKMVIRERGEFDNSVRKYQHQENKTCYKIINYA